MPGVEDEQDVVRVAEAAQGAEPFGAEMIVAAFALDRLDDDGGDVRAASCDDLAIC